MSLPIYDNVRAKIGWIIAPAVASQVLDDVSLFFFYSLLSFRERLIGVRLTFTEINWIIWFLSAKQVFIALSIARSFYVYVSALPFNFLRR